MAEKQVDMIDAATKLAEAVLDANYYNHDGIDNLEMQPVEGWPEIRKMAKAVIKAKEE